MTECKKCGKYIDFEHLRLFNFELNSGDIGSSFRGLCGGDESCDTSYGWDIIKNYPRTEEVKEESK